MRDPKRIKRILELLERVWNLNPDWRLGQLLVNFTSKDEADLFFIEDDNLQKYLEQYLFTEERAK